jgi:8-oxo-dGTP diphosphatase
VSLDPADYEVHAAGGLIHRDGAAGFQVLIVHRPRYDDWSLPKGKLDEGEDFQAAALREVREETGLRCTLGDELEPTTYRDRKDRAKIVRYWAMTVEDPTDVGTTDDEVDQMRWASAEEAEAMLSYGRDRKLVTRFAAAR